VTDIMLSTLKDAREITGTALGVVTDAIRGAFRATGGRRRGGAGCPGRRIQGRGGRGPGRRDVTKVARGAAEQALDTVVEVSPDVVGAVKRAPVGGLPPRGRHTLRHRGRGERK
jgi:hypothetical protein